MTRPGKPLPTLELLLKGAAAIICQNSKAGHFSQPQVENSR
jgi:hypothetical protein